MAASWLKRRIMNFEDSQKHRTLVISFFWRQLTIIFLSNSGESIFILPPNKKSKNSRSTALLLLHLHLLLRARIVETEMNLFLAAKYCCFFVYNAFDKKCCVTKPSWMGGGREREMENDHRKGNDHTSPPSSLRGAHRKLVFSPLFFFIQRGRTFLALPKFQPICKWCSLMLFSKKFIFLGDGTYT